MRMEGHAVVVDSAAPLVAEHLIASRIGENGARPGHEGVQPTHVSHQPSPWTHGQMIGVGQDNLRAERFQIAGGQRLHRGLRAHWHEHGRLDRAMIGLQQPSPRFTTACLYHERDTHLGRLPGRMNMASP